MLTPGTLSAFIRSPRERPTCSSPFTATGPDRPDVTSRMRCSTVGAGLSCPAAPRAERQTAASRPSRRANSNAFLMGSPSKTHSGPAAALLMMVLRHSRFVTEFEASRAAETAHLAKRTPGFVLVAGASIRSKLRRWSRYNAGGGIIMLARMAGIVLAMACVTAARNHDSDKPADTRGENESVVITATVFARPEAVKELLGSDLGGHYIVV